MTEAGAATGPISGLDPSDPSFATGATGLLATFNRAAVLAPADVHTAIAVARLSGETDERVRLALALAVRAVRSGSVCLDLATVHATTHTELEQAGPGEGRTAGAGIDVSALPWPDPAEWSAAVRASPMVANGAESPDGRPLRWAHGLLYLQRYWLQEEQVRTEWLRRESAARPPVDPDRLAAALPQLFDGSGLPDGEVDRQRIAAAIATLRWVSVIAGGPGTGKTTTVARVLALLLDQQPQLRIALAAPTGKAAARLAQAVHGASVGLASEHAGRIAGLGASTLHRLLGWLPGARGRFRYHRGNHLPYDVIVVDETSMVSLTMMARLLEAVRHDARLIFVGDPDQLSSVEAGAVLADIATAPGPADPALATALEQVGAGRLPVAEAVVHGVVRLTHTWRYDGAIDALAQAIRASDPDRVIEVLRGHNAEVVFVETDVATLELGALAPLRERVTSVGARTHAAAVSGSIVDALSALDEHRLLCAHRRGPYGVTRWGDEAERWLIEELGSPESRWDQVNGSAGNSSTVMRPSGGRPAGRVGRSAPGDDRVRAAEWYPGRPLLITANDYEMGLYNGDTGVVVATPAGPRAAFSRGADPTMIAPVRLDSVQTVHAMTVHRAQGSQFGCVSFIVPPADSPLLTRELLYTAVTRATDRVQLFGTEDAVRRAVTRPANRASGLRTRLDRAG